MKISVSIPEVKQWVEDCRKDRRIGADDGVSP